MKSLSLDGKIVASASGLLLPRTQQRPELILWDAATGKELRALEGYTGASDMGSLAFSPDGSRIAAFCTDGIRIWERQSGKVLQTFPAENRPNVDGLSFSPDGRILAATSGTVVRLWNVQTGKERKPSLESHAATLTCVAFSPDGERIVAGAAAGGGFFPPPTVLAWDVRTGKRVLALTHPLGVIRVAVSPDGKSIASAGGDYLVRVWDVASRREKATLRGHASMVTGVAFSPDSRRLLSSSWDGSIRVWDPSTGSPLRTLRGHASAVNGLAFRPDGRRLASCGVDGTVRIWEWQRDQETLTLDEPLGPVASLAFHPDGRHLASGSYGVSLWDLPAGKVSRSFKEFLINFPTMAVAFSPDGKRLATRSATVKVWDMVSGKKLFGKDPSPFGGPGEPKEDLGLVWWLAFSPDGKQVASGGMIRDAATGELVRRIDGRERGPAGGGAVAYSPDGKYLASVGNGVVLVDTATGEVVRTFPGFPDTVLRVAFTPDGRRLLAASDSRARAWDISSGEEVIHFSLTSTHNPTGFGTINPGRASFSADGQRLALASLGDGTVGVWDMTTGQQTLSLRGPGTQVMAVAFSADGHWLAAGGFDGSKGVLRLWDARPVEEKQE